MEFLIPRMGRRADLIVIVAGIIFVAEYKLGARQFDRSSLDQVYGYGLDLKHFHETSHAVPIVPILVASHAAVRPSLSRCAGMRTVSLTRCASTPLGWTCNPRMFAGCMAADTH